MDKLAFIQDAYEKAFVDELEKIAATGYESITKVPEMTMRMRKSILNNILKGKGTLKDTTKKSMSSEEIKKLKYLFKQDALGGAMGKKNPRLMGRGDYQEYLNMREL